MANDIASSTIYDTRGDINFEIINFHFLDGDVPHFPSYGVYNNNRTQLLTAKCMLLKQGYRYHNFVKYFLNSYTDKQN